MLRLYLLLYIIIGLGEKKNQKLPQEAEHEETFKTCYYALLKKYQAQKKQMLTMAKADIRFVTIRHMPQNRIQ